MKLLLKTFFRIASFCLVPICAHAMVFSEIYYDPKGTDTGHEFVEIYNDGDQPVDLTGWKLFEANTNHGLVLYSGNPVLGPGEYAVIADQPATIVNDFPGINTVFDSVFSLNNTGETIALKNQSLAITDQITYTSDQGASEDGNSLNSIDGGLVPRTPSPGAAPASNSFLLDDNSNNGTEGSSEETQTQTETTNTASDIQTSTNASVVYSDNDIATKDPRYTLTLQTNDVINANSPTTFEGILKRDDAMLLTGRFEWSLGDGTVFQRDKTLKFDYTYDVPGTYVVVLEYYRTTFDDVPFLRVQKKLHVVSGNITVASVDQHGTVILKNNESVNINLAGWRMVANGNIFTFANNTFVLPNDTIAIPQRVHHLSVSKKSSVSIQKPDGTLVSNFSRLPVSEIVTDENISSAGNDLLRINDNNQQANTGGIHLNGILPWILGLLGVLIIVGIGCAVLMLRWGKHIELPHSEGEQHSKQPNFSADDIELLM